MSDSPTEHALRCRIKQLEAEAEAYKALAFAARFLRARIFQHTRTRRMVVEQADLDAFDAVLRRVEGE